MNLRGATQHNLVISPYYNEIRDQQPTITVDNIEVAQFIFLLLHNDKIRHVIDTITSKVVLILGRFTEQRKPLLDRIRVELRNHDYLPVLFDFERPASKSFIETVGTLAQLSRFVIVDLTDARIVLDEVPYIARWTSVPIRPIIRVGQEEPVTLADLRKNHRSVLPTYVYEDSDSLFAVFQKEIIEPAEAKARELR